MLDSLGPLADRLLAALQRPDQALALASAAVAGLLVVISAFVRTMIPLRWLAVAGNFGFIVFGALHPQWLTLVVAAVLLPINVYRARQMMRLTRRVRAAEASGDSSVLWLRPYMKSRRLQAGEVVFRKGDLADQLYCLVDGQVELVEIGQRLEPGRIFGEIAFFAPDRQRTLTARCVDAATVLMIDEVTLKQLYHQNPSFGFHLITLVAARLSQDVKRAERRLDELRGATRPQG